MALETLEGVTEIDGFALKRVVSETNPDLPSNPIEVDDNNNSITFKIQNGPVGPNGVNGCQVDTIIAAAALIVIGLNEKFNCTENDFVIAHLHSAMRLLKKRKDDREARGVEGENKE